MQATYVSATHFTGKISKTKKEILKDFCNMEYTYAARFVRDLVVDEKRFNDAMVCIEQGNAFVQEDYLVTVMIDISGYSKITSMLTKLGKVSSEMITQTLGTYLSQHDTNLRATLCCLRILSEYSEFEVSFDDIADSTSGNILRRRSLKNDDSGKILLHLHLAMTSGDMSRVIMGIPSERLDYSVSGSRLLMLGNILEGTKSGELGIDENIWKGLFTDGGIPAIIKSIISFDIGFVKCSKQAAAVVWDYCMNKKKVNLSNFTNTESSKLIVEQQSPVESRLAKFVNQSLWKSFVGKMSRRTRKSSVVSQSSENELKILGQFRRPFAHPNEPEQALKAAIEFEAIAQKKLEGRVSIGLSTGDLLFTSLGTVSRQEAGLLGDVVNIAARLMSIVYPNGSILVDEVTHQGSINSFVHMDIGEHYIKGKDMPLRLWSISAHTFQGANTEGIYGYIEEKKFILDKYTEWKESKRESIIFVEAASGLGKSTLGSFASNLAISHAIPVCLIQGKEKFEGLQIIRQLIIDSGTEIEQRTPYFGMGGIMSFIYTQFKNMKTTSRKQHLEITDERFLSTSKSDLISRMTGARTPTRKNSITDSNEVVDFMTLGGIGKFSNEFMRYHGENSTLAPLLGMVIPSLKIPDTEQTAKLDSQAKNNLLKTLIMRIFNSYVCKHECLFLFDDSQWLDDMSLAMIMTLIKFAQKEFMIILSRPVSSSGSEILNQISQHTKVEHLELRGLSTQAVEEIIVNRCTQTTRQVISVESTLLDAIIQKGSRFPLYTDMIGSLLQEKIGKELRVDDSGCLKLKDAEIKIDDILLDTVGAAIISQFDRLPGSFQEILRVACCLGQYFKLDDVLEVGGLEITTQEAFTEISESDRYNFLDIIIDYPSRDTLTDDNVETVYSCSFRHISIMNAIYESLSYADRVSLNLTAARRLESILTAENEDMILPAMSFHYARTVDFGKEMWCLETLGYKYVQRCAFAEGAKTLTRLEEIYNALDLNKRNQVNGLRRAHWLAETSWAWVQLKKMAECQMTAFQALNLIQPEPWPRNEPDVQRQFKKSLVRLLKLWALTMGGKRKLPSHQDGNTSIKKIAPSSAKNLSEVNISTTGTITLSRDSIRERCLSSLIVVPIYDPTFMKAMSALIMIELLCHIIIRATEDPVTWRIYLGRATLMFYFPAKALAKIFFQRLLQEEMRHGAIVNIHYLQLTCILAIVKPPFYAYGVKVAVT
ncbi:hypothetical protein HDU76_011073 [Blyttiomyces sp. JEL0837]|nr:hypothetical protein HDU76_011073 [Blyttiomyces sp. JEL0837]